MRSAGALNRICMALHSPPHPHPPPNAHRFDVGQLDPEALVGLELRVRFDNGKHYPGRVVAWDQDTYRHKVRPLLAPGPSQSNPPSSRQPWQAKHASCCIPPCLVQILYDDGDEEESILGAEGGAIQVCGLSAEGRSNDGNQIQMACGEVSSGTAGCRHHPCT